MLDLTNSYVIGYIGLWICWIVLCMSIAARKGMDRFTALLSGTIFGILAVAYYALAEPDKKKERNSAVLYSLVALAIGIMISAAIVWAKMV